MLANSYHQFFQRLDMFSLSCVKSVFFFSSKTWFHKTSTWFCCYCCYFTFIYLIRAYLGYLCNQRINNRKVVTKSKSPAIPPTLSSNQANDSLALATEYRGACTVLDFTSGHAGLVMNSEQYTPDMTENVASNH